MLSQVHSNLETFRWATKRGSMNRHTRQWTSTGPKNRPVLQWSNGRVTTAKELVVELGFQVIGLDFTDTYYSTGKLEDSLQRDYMGVPLGRRLFRCVAGHPCKDNEGDVKTVEVFLAYSFEVMPAIRSGRVVLVR